MDRISQFFQKFFQRRPKQTTTYYQGCGHTILIVVRDADGKERRIIADTIPPQQ